jgi:maltooligosyltrehalose trehalohydrolase
LYFADHEVDIATLVREGRWEFLRCFPRTASFESHGVLPDPSSDETFKASKLDWSDCERGAETLLLVRDLLRLRRADPVFSRQDAWMIDGAVIGPEGGLLRWHGDEGDDRLLLFNFGRDFQWRPVAEPLMAAPSGCHWQVYWSSEDPRYGGSGTGLLNTKDWTVPGHAAIVLRPSQKMAKDDDSPR